MDSIYNTALWHEVRAAALKRDGHRCTVARWLGGACAPGPLHVHHLHAVAEGGAAFDLDNVGTACAAHHPMWEALRRVVVARMTGQDDVPRCTHRHVTPEARALCERQMRRRLVAA